MDKKACKILCTMMMAVLFLLGCAEDASYRPEPYKPPMNRLLLPLQNFAAT